MHRKEPNKRDRGDLHRIDVDSTALASVGYDVQRELLEIEFVSGEMYQYFEIPSEVQELMAADSHGQYFMQHIRGRYKYDLWR